MAGFKCSQCGALILMEGQVQTTGCSHHPLPDNPRLLQRRKNALIQFLEHRTGLKLRGSDVKIAKQMISLIWNMGFKDEHIRQFIDIWLNEEKRDPSYLTWSWIYRNMERTELRYANKVIEVKSCQDEEKSKEI